MSHVAVIGAGVTGITTAYALALRGYDVTVLDRNRDPAMGTSYANGGQLSASNAEVWTTAATILKGIKWMMRRDAPLLVNPWPSWHKYSWMAEFVGQIPNYRRNTVDTVRLAIIAQKHLTRIAETEGIEFHRENTGILHLYRAKAGFDHAMQVNELLSEGGLDRKAVTPEEMRAIEPTLQGDYYGGFYTASDFTGDIHAFTRGLASACERRGVKFMYDTDVRLLAHQGGGIAVDWHHADKRREPRALETLKADAVVICAGVASPRFARQLGDRVNIYPVKGYSITIPLLTEQSSRGAPRVSLLDDETKIVSSSPGRAFPGGRNGRIQRLQPRYPCRSHKASGGMDPGSFPRGRYELSDPLGRAEADDPEHGAARRLRESQGCLLQHRARPSGLDTLRRDRGNRRGNRPRRHPLSQSRAPGTRLRASRHSHGS